MLVYLELAVVTFWGGIVPLSVFGVLMKLCALPQFLTMAETVTPKILVYANMNFIKTSHFV